jgi:threonine dehydratase
MTTTNDRQLGLRRVFEASRRISSYVRRTPLIPSQSLSKRAGAEVWLKPESWQPTGSFKIRGALNKLAMLAEAGARPALAVASAGNHGLGVAYAAACLGLNEVDIFVPRTAPSTKLDKLLRWPVRLHQVGNSYEDAHQAAESFAAREGALSISAYNDEDVIAGQGTVGLEIVLELPDVDLILVPVGGGGLIAGISSVVKAVSPKAQVIGVQPEASPAALLSLRDGVAYDPYEHEPTIADGLAGGFGEVPLRLATGKVKRILLANERELRQAVYQLVQQEQLVIEPSGAASITPLQNGAVEVRGRKVVCVLSGANIMTSLLAQILSEGESGSYS